MSACPKCGSTEVARTNVWKAKLMLLPVLFVLAGIVVSAISPDRGFLFIMLSPLLAIVLVLIILKQRGRTWRCNRCKAPFFWDDKTK